MIFIDNEGGTDPKLNLALEEYALRNFDASTDYLLFYINAPSIIIGRNQNTIEEINQEYIDKNGIKVVRRISGGGAVYHDLGNLNFSFITNHDGKSISNFKKFTEPVIRVLNELGVTAELKGRNDILVDEKKISGTAQFSTGKRMISHGTLLFNTDMSEVGKALHVKMSKIQSKGHKSVRSRVANISEFLKEPITMDHFKKQLLTGLYEAKEDFEIHKLTEAEWKAVHELKETKYDLWDWNFGNSPKFNIQRNKRFPIGEIDLRIFVEKGHISDFKIYGDFFGRQPIADLEKRLIGVPYDKNEITNKLCQITISDYFGKLENSEFIDLVYGND
ncbi:lipoate--protein ligase [Polaribacter atrinae]|uniref:lipoate--protein ligase n=1 Tax=Polaribacter atrinae TaxID=1333662 RepID=A0A176TB53_9FLAO|nr:lipoate--protein ligase [Polaribacter atrinae]OAD44989.1 lipoate--protein ligase [Polaribacter atrinae]